tara:strand:- start:264 stop:380 length:117 start_codon:yes stop_codon:yes gene_type:complete
MSKLTEYTKEAADNKMELYYVKPQEIFDRVGLPFYLVD